MLHETSKQRNSGVGTMREAWMNVECRLKGEVLLIGEHIIHTIALNDTLFVHSILAVFD